MKLDSETPVYAKSAFILLSLSLSLLILYFAEAVFAPLVFALFGAILLNPIVNFLCMRKMPRIIAIVIALCLAFLVTGLLIFFLSLQISMFSKTYPQLKEKYQITSNQIVNWTASSLNIDDSTLVKYVDNAESVAIKSLTGGVGHTIITLSGIIAVMVLIPVYIFLMLYYKSLLLEFIRKLFKSDHHQAVVDVLENIKIIIQSYLIGLLVEGAIVATLNSIGLLILGVQSAIILGITGAILNVIPYIGGIAAIALPMVVAFVTKSWASALLVLAIYMVIQFVDNHYLVPYIVASKVKINALIALIMVLVGDLIWGIPGMFISIPAIALVKVICDHITVLKPWGFLLGDNIPPSIKLPFSKARKPQGD